MPLDEIGFALPKTLLVFNELLTGLSGKKIKAWFRDKNRGLQELIGRLLRSYIFTDLYILS